MRLATGSGNVSLYTRQGNAQRQENVEGVHCFSSGNECRMFEVLTQNLDRRDRWLEKDSVFNEWNEQ